MNHKKTFYWLILLCITCLMTHLSVLSLEAANAPAKSSIAQILTLPNRGAPGQRRGAGTRSPCSAGEPLTALVPGSNLGLTSAGHTTFWFYVPYTADRRLYGQFSLKDSQGKDIHTRTVSLTGTPGIISIQLPKTVSPIEVGKLYYWSFSISCQTVELANVSGGVERIALTDEVNRKLATATPKERVTIYAENGLWFDLVAELARLHSTNPQDKAIEQDWLALWQTVGLDDIASKALISCCSAD